MAVVTTVYNIESTKITILGVITLVSNYRMGGGHSGFYIGINMVNEILYECNPRRSKVIFYYREPACEPEPRNGRVFHVAVIMITRKHSQFLVRHT